MEKFTVARFNQIYPDEAACLDTVRDIVYPDGVHCERCGEVTEHHRIHGRKAYACKSCLTQVYPLAGTIFSKSSTPLKSWFYAMYLMASTRTGISAKQLQRELGVTYKTAWRMFTEIRKLMAEDASPLFGEVEADETYVGGKRPGKRGRGAAGKTIVAGVAQRQGPAVVAVVPDVKARTLLPFIQEHIPVAPGTTVYTDELHSYDRLSALGYAHETVQHRAKQYVNGKAHTNNLEGLWSNTKRGIDGVHHAVSPQHLQGYLDAYVFRYNHRDDETPMYQLIARRIKQVRTDNFGKYNPIG